MHRPERSLRSYSIGAGTIRSVVATSYVLRSLDRLTFKVGTVLRSRIQEVPELRNEFSATYVSADERKSALNTVLRNIKTFT